MHGECLYVKVLGDQFRIWMPRKLVVKVNQVPKQAA
jgi:hypothetical protein